MSALSGIYARNGVTFLCNNVLVPSNKCHTSRLVFHLIKMATCWPSLLGCCNNMPQTGWLKTTEMYYLAVRRLNIWDQGFSSVGSFWDWWRRLSAPYLTPLSGGLLAVLGAPYWWYSLCILISYSPHTYLHPNFPHFYEDTSWYRIGAYPDDLILILLPL